MTMLSLTTESTINSEGCAPIVQSNKTTLGGMNEKRKWMNEDTPTKSRMNEKRTWMNKDGSSGEDEDEAREERAGMREGGGPG